MNKNSKSRNSILKCRAKLSSAIDRNNHPSKYISATNDASKSAEENTAQQKKTRKMSKTLRVLTLGAVVLLLVSSLIVGITLSWFFVSYEDTPGTRIETGGIVLNVRTYKSGESVSLPAYDLVRFFDSDIENQNSVNLFTGIQQKVGLFADSSGVYDDLYIVVERDADSIGLDLHLSMEVEAVNPGESLTDCLNAFYFQLENVTSKVENSTEAEPSVYDYTSSSAVSETTEAEGLLQGYIDADYENIGSAYPMTMISTDTDVNTATNLEGGTICVYRLSTYLSENARMSGLYQNISFQIKLNLTIGQTGMFTGGVQKTYYVSSMYDLNNACAACNPGDIIEFLEDIYFTGDMVVHQPVTLELGGNSLTVYGNLSFTSSYSGNFIVNIGEGGCIEVSADNGGGNIYIQAPNSSFEINGQNDEDNPDIIVAGEISVDCSIPAYSDYTSLLTDTGFTVNQARICQYDEQADEYVLAELIILDDTRVNVTESSAIGSIVASSGIKVISIVNWGTIDEIDLSGVSVAASNNTYAIDCSMPQIYIDNFSVINEDIILPQNAVVFTAGTPCSGNTRIVSEFNSTTIHVTARDGFTDSDIEKIAQNVYDYGTYLLVYYHNFGDYSGTIDLDAIFYADQAGTGYQGYFTANPTVNISSIKKIVIISGNDDTDGLDEDDYETLKDFTGLEVLDLSSVKTLYAYDLGGEILSSAIPDEAFSGLTSLKELTLPDNTEYIGADIVYDTLVHNLYLPEGIDSSDCFDESAFTGVLYLHIQSEDFPISGLDDTSRYLFVPEGKLDGYRDEYTDSMQYVFAEATLDSTGRYFYRILSDNTAEIAVWVGGTDSLSTFSYDLITPESATYYVSGYDDYCFYGKINNIGEKTIILSSKTRKVGDYAFADCESIKNLSLVSDTLTRVGYKAFSGCTNLTDVTISGVNNTVEAKIAATTSYDVTEAENYLFENCESITNLTIEYVDEINEYVLKQDDSTVLPFERLIITNTETVADNAAYIYDGSDIGATELKELILNNVTSVGESAFRHATDLDKITISGNETLSESAFEGCTSLFAFRSDDTTVVGKYLFRGCTSLVAAALPNFTECETTSADNMNVFDGCSSLQILETGIPAVSSCKNFLDSGNTGSMVDDLRVWILNPDTKSSTVWPSSFLQWNNTNETLFLIPTTFPTSNMGQRTWIQTTYSELYWASDVEDGGVELWKSDYTGKTLSDYGFGDFICSKTVTAGSYVTTVWRSLIKKVTGTHTIADLSYNGGTVSIGQYAFEYLEADGGVYPTDSKPYLILPSSVTVIGQYSFKNCDLLGIEAPEVKTLPLYAFQNSANLRVAKFVKCNFIEYHSYNNSTTSAGKKRCIAEAFNGCTLLNVLELGVIKSSLYSNYNTISGLLYGCTNFKYLIIHTENAESNTTLFTDFIPYAFSRYSGNSYPTGGQLANAVDFKIIISSNTSNLSTKNYYSQSTWAGTLPNCGSWANRNWDLTSKLLCTGEYTANQYVFADESNSNVTRTTLGGTGTWYLDDIGYGEYICADESGNVSLINALINNNSVSTGTYTVPGETVDGVDITAIADEVFKSISFNNVTLVIPDTILTIGNNAFENASGTKSFSQVVMNGVQSLGTAVFKSCSITEVECGENLTNLGTNTFYDTGTSLESIILKCTTQKVILSSGFSTTPNANLRVHVTASAYNYYASGWWGGTDASNAVSSSILDTCPIAHFTLEADVYTYQGVNYYYTEFTDDTTGIDGYIIVKVEIVNSGLTTIDMPSDIPAGGNAAVNPGTSDYSPVLGIDAAALSGLSTSNAITLNLPKYLKFYSYDNSLYMPATLQSFGISNTVRGDYNTWESDGLESTLCVNAEGILFKTGYTELVCVPRAIMTSTVDIDENIQYVNMYAISNCNSDEVLFSNTNSTFVLGKNAIYNCSDLTSIEIAGKAFFDAEFVANCSDLAEITLSSTTHISVFVGDTFADTLSELEIVVDEDLYDDYSQSMVGARSLISKLSIG